MKNDWMAEAISDLRYHRGVMVAYLDLRRSLEDWHGVQDAASDIRELDAQIRLLELRRHS